jgi:hypothetical protein
MDGALLHRAPAITNGDGRRVVLAFTIVREDLSQKDLDTIATQAPFNMDVLL